ncbi:UvrB/UvrC motif-containing protein [uncultured Kiloniella sp.]|uniref:UvrB/UvrC motif-containing protein n=1 Tax=uncultured Kiloniella sp. TaxID=1133091 RepID=UPI00262AFC67|nr:UvrB/UvrC motif-containing protein [uncultured Kiloniella sp.]
MHRTGYVRNSYKNSETKKGLVSLTALLVLLISLSTVSVSLAAILSPETFLAQRMTEQKKDEIKKVLKKLYNEMDLATQNLDFEQAAMLRDDIEELEKKI